VDGLTNADAAGKGGCGVEHSGHHDDGDLADWLGLNVSELDWFADLKGLACKRNHSRLSHYHYRILAKESGNIRLIEAPKARLKELQQKILREILERIPVHDTRYADDLAFSGDEDFERRAKRFSIHAAAMVMKEGFRINHRKTRVMKRSVKQHLAGLIAKGEYQTSGFRPVEGHSHQLRGERRGNPEPRRSQGFGRASERTDRIPGIRQSG